MLAEFLIELKLHEEQDKIAQIVTGTTGTVKHSMYVEYINASKACKGKVPAKGKASKEKVKVASPSGIQHVKKTGSQAVVHKGTIVQCIMQGDSQGDVQPVALPVTILLNADVQ